MRKVILLVVSSLVAGLLLALASQVIKSEATYQPGRPLVGQGRIDYGWPLYWQRQEVREVSGAAGEKYVEPLNLLLDIAFWSVLSGMLLALISTQPRRCHGTS